VKEGTMQNNMLRRLEDRTRPKSSKQAHAPPGHQERVRQLRLGLAQALLRPSVPGLQPACRTLAEACASLGIDERGDRVPGTMWAQEKPSRPA